LQKATKLILAIARLNNLRCYSSYPEKKIKKNNNQLIKQYGMHGMPS